MIINPFLNNPKKLDYQLSNSIYKPKTKKNETKKKLEKKESVIPVNLKYLKEIYTARKVSL